MLIKGNLKNHPFHLVELSPWPFYMALSLMVLGLGIINMLIFHIYYLISLGLFLIISVFTFWFRDIMREGTGGKHTKSVQKGLTIGFL